MSEKRVIISTKMTIIVIAICIVIVGAFLYRDYNPSRQPQESNGDEKEQGIDKDEETGMYFVNNELIVILDSSLSIEDANIYLSSFDATIDRGLEHYRMYRLIFARAYTYAELEAMVIEIKTDQIVENAFISLPFQFGPDAEGSNDKS